MNNRSTRLVYSSVCHLFDGGNYSQLSTGVSCMYNHCADTIVWWWCCIMNRQAVDAHWSVLATRSCLFKE